jgi:hypothetical protein
MQTPSWEQPRVDFLDPSAVATSIVEAIFSPLNVSMLGIER